jgi:RHS repeat-associated protein
LKTVRLSLTVPSESRGIIKSENHQIANEEMNQFPESRAPNPESRPYADFLGSSRAITTVNGTLCYDTDLYPFGGELAFVNNCAQHYKFAGMERETETGNDYTQYRRFAFNLARWLSPDPVAGDVTNPRSLKRI